MVTVGSLVSGPGLPSSAPYRERAISQIQALFESILLKLTAGEWSRVRRTRRRTNKRQQDYHHRFAHISPTLQTRGAQAKRFAARRSARTLFSVIHMAGPVLLKSGLSRLLVGRFQGRKEWAGSRETLERKHDGGSQDWKIILMTLRLESGQPFPSDARPESPLRR